MPRLMASDKVREGGAGLSFAWVSISPEEGTDVSVAVAGISSACGAASDGGGSCAGCDSTTSGSSTGISATAGSGNSVGADWFGAGLRFVDRRVCFGYCLRFVARRLYLVRLRLDQTSLHAATAQPSCMLIWLH